MTVERADRALEDPDAQLETALIDEFLRIRGLARPRLQDLPEAYPDSWARRYNT